MRTHSYTLKGALRVTDEDAADFLQSQFSSDLRPFENGQCTYGLWLDVKGKVVADSFIVCRSDEEFLLLSEHCETHVIQEKLEQHIIADDVLLEPVPQLYGLAILGVGVEEHAESCAGLVAFSGRRARHSSVELIFETESAREEYRQGLSSPEISETELHSERISAGIPLIPSEIGPSDLPGEGKLEKDAVSFTKGCFLGQEVIARMHNLGKATRSLFRVSGEGARPRCPVGLLTEEGKRAGELRTAFASSDGWFGVALVKLRYSSESLHLEDAQQRITLGGELMPDSQNE